VHYKGGCVLAWDMLTWATSMLIFNARPPDPRLVGERWREMWLERLDKRPYVEHWMAHQRRDGYWRHGSVCEDYAAIECPVYAIGGWADGYTNAVPRLLAGLPGPRKGLIGPWSHSFPDESVPGPSIGFLQECVRWWDRWLKGIENGIEDEPQLRAWMQEPVAPAPQHELRPGRWVGERRWPSPRIEPFTLHLNAAGLEAGASAADELELRTPQSAGEDAGVWCGGGQVGESPPDQRREDGLALSFTSEPLGRTLELLGFPELRLRLASDRPLALVAARLCDVFPDGTSLLVSRALMNLAHRDGHERPAPLTPGEPFEVVFPLDALAHAFPAGHRIRLALSTTYWPWAWPSPEPATLRLECGEASRLVLPVRPPDPGDCELPRFAEPEGGAPLRTDVLRPGLGELSVRRDAAGAVAEQRFVEDMGGLVRYHDIGLDAEDTMVTDFRIREGDPLSAEVRCSAATTMARGDWSIRVDVESTMRADAGAFHLVTRLDAYEGDERVFAKTWRREVARDHV
jgi:predicted acyl esterase